MPKSKYYMQRSMPTQPRMGQLLPNLLRKFGKTYYKCFCQICVHRRTSSSIRTEAIVSVVLSACDPLFPQKLFSVNHPFSGGSHAQTCNNNWKMNSQVCIPMEQESGQVLGGLSTDQDCVQSRGRGCAGHGATDVQCSQLYSSLCVVVAQRAAPS